MENAKAEHRPTTLIGALEKLDDKCNKLRGLSELSDKMSRKLNRTDDKPKEIKELLQKEEFVQKNIVELFDEIANKMEMHINNIGNNLENSISMID